MNCFEPYADLSYPTPNFYARDQVWQATFLGRVNKQKFKVNYKKIFIFFLTVLFCCDVGESGVDIGAANGPLHKKYKKCAFTSVITTLQEDTMGHQVAAGKV